MGLILLVSNSRYRFSREQQVDAKSRRRRSEVPQIERHQRVSAAIDSRFQHHFVARVAQLRPPKEMCINGLRHGDYRGYKDIHLSNRKPRRQLMLGLGTDGFIFERQSDSEQERCLALPRCPQDGGRRAAGAAHPGYNGVRVQNDPHIAYNITSRAILQLLFVSCVNCPARMPFSQGPV
jgi:hypothetical protein